MQLNLKRVLLTGAARGIGFEMAKTFAARGCEVVLTDRDAATLDEAREAIAATGSRCRSYAVDVTDHDSILAARDAVHRDLGRIDILVNNAGVVHGGPFLEVPLERHLQTYRVNVDGVVQMTHAFLPDLIASSRSQAVFIASASGFVGLPNGSTYASSKWAVIGFAESIRAEMNAQDLDHVGVTTVCPTYIATGMFEGAEPPKTTKMLSPQAIAEKVVEAVEKDRVWVKEPFLAKITPLLKHGLPTGVSDYLSDAFGATHSMDSWTGHDQR